MAYYTNKEADIIDNKNSHKSQVKLESLREFL